MKQFFISSFGECDPSVCAMIFRERCQSSVHECAFFRKIFYFWGWKNLWVLMASSLTVLGVSAISATKALICSSLRYSVTCTMGWIPLKTRRGSNFLGKGALPNLEINNLPMNQGCTSDTETKPETELNKNSNDDTSENISDNNKPSDVQFVRVKVLLRLSFGLPCGSLMENSKKFREFPCDVVVKSLGEFHRLQL